MSKLFLLDYRKMFQPFAEAVGTPGVTFGLMNILLNDTVCKGFELFPAREISEAVFDYFNRVVIPHKINVLNEGNSLLDKIITKNDDPVKNEVRHLLYIHDLSKFSLSEALGYYAHDFKSDKPDLKFEEAWHHHKMNNPHHPEYWINPNKEGIPEPLPMPMKYVIEMVADWMGAGLSYGSSLEEWLPNNLHKFFFHSVTTDRLVIVLMFLGISTYQDDNRLYFDKIVKS